MVLGNALCALNLVSTVMANGVCCFYEMRKEEERKKEQEASIRSAIHSEWEKQRYFEMMARKSNPELDARGDDNRDSLLRQSPSFASVPERIDHSDGYSTWLRPRTQWESPRFADQSATWNHAYNSKATSIMDLIQNGNGDYQKRMYHPEGQQFDLIKMKHSSLMDSDDEFEDICIE